MHGVPATRVLLVDVLLDVLDRLADGLDLLRVLVGDADVELFLELHDELDGVERVGPEIVDERGLGGHLLARHTQLIAHDVGDLLGDRRCHNTLPRPSASVRPLRNGRQYYLMSLGRKGHMARPPSTWSTSPVMYAARSLARKTAA